MNASRDNHSEVARENDQPTDFASLAKRITGWSSNFLATCLILMAGAVFGRQVLLWWREDARSQDRYQEASELVGPGGLGAGGQLHELEFGQMPFSLGRESHSGDRQELLSKLRKACRLAAQKAPHPASQVRPAELRLLARTAGMSPVEQQPGEWAVYELDGPVPLVVGVREFPSSGSSSAGRQVAAREPRVVSWGLGIHLSGTRWTLFTFQAADPTARPLIGLPPLPVPPGCRRTLALRAEGREAIIGFVGKTKAEEGRAFYERWFTDQAFSASPWRRSENIWQARFEHAEFGWVDVQLLVENFDMTGGLLTAVAPAQERSRER